RCSLVHSGDSNSRGLTSAKNLNVNPLRGYTNAQKYSFHLGHKTIWSAKVDFRFAWYTNAFESRFRKTAGGIEVFLLVQAWLGVTNVAAAVSKRAHEAADFS